MSARLLRLLAGALILGSYVHAAGHAVPTARLTGVSTTTEGPGTTVVIETTEPVAYVAAQPDPLTLLVDLRNVAPGDVRPDAPSGAVAGVAVEAGTSDDGTGVSNDFVRRVTPAGATVWTTRMVPHAGSHGEHMSDMATGGGVVATVGWDFSHARRLVHALDTLERQRAAFAAVFAIPEVPDVGPTYFLKLALTGPDGKEASSKSVR